MNLFKNFVEYKLGFNFLCIFKTIDSFIILYKNLQG